MKDREILLATMPLAQRVRIVLVMDSEDWIIKPQEDMTGAESMAMTMLLFAVWHKYGYNKMDIKGYVEEHKLWRHLEKTIP
jgi:hypothetical protein